MTANRIDPVAVARSTGHWIRWAIAMGMWLVLLKWSVWEGYTERKPPMKEGIVPVDFDQEVVGAPHRSCPYVLSD